VDQERAEGGEGEARELARRDRLAQKDHGRIGIQMSMAPLMMLDPSHRACGGFGFTG
jgi:hypothetical protein